MEVDRWRERERERCLFVESYRFSVGSRSSSEPIQSISESDGTFVMRAHDDKPLYIHIYVTVCWTLFCTIRFVHYSFYLLSHSFASLT